MKSNVQNMKKEESNVICTTKKFLLAGSKYKLITIAFNPTVLQQFGRDSTLVAVERRLLINLAIDYVQVNIFLNFDFPKCVLQKLFCHK